MLEDFSGKRECVLKRRKARRKHLSNALRTCPVDRSKVSKQLSQIQLSDELSEIYTRARKIAGLRSVHSTDLLAAVIELRPWPSDSPAFAVTNALSEEISQLLVSVRSSPLEKEGELASDSNGGFTKGAVRVANICLQLAKAEGLPKADVQHLLASLLSRSQGTAGAHELAPFAVHINQARRALQMWIKNENPELGPAYEGFLMGGTMKAFERSMKEIGTKDTSEAVTTQEISKQTIKRSKNEEIASIQHGNESNANTEQPSIEPPAPKYKDATVYVDSAEASISVGARATATVTENMASRLKALARADFANDTIDGRDCLGISREVDAFAKLIASKSTSAPLAISLFGSWGSGKSFFMAQLQDRIDSLEMLDSRSAYCSNIYQIAFNAWHFSDSNLWASIVDHVFCELSSQLNPAEQTELDELSLTDQIQAGKKLLEEAQEKHVAAQSDLSEAKAKFTDAQAKLRERQNALADLTAKDLATHLLQSSELNQVLAEARRTLGIDDVGHLLEEAKAQGRTAVQLIDRSKAIFSLLKAKPVLIAVLLVQFALPFLPSLFASLGYKWPVGWSLTAIIPFLAWTLASTGGWLRLGQRAVARLETEVDALRSKQEASQIVMRQEVDSAKASADQAATSAQAAAEEVATKAAELGKVEQHLSDLRSGALFAKFVHERARTEDYRKHGGIVSTVRQDFERLSKLISARDFASDQGQLTRIVLYIDDLDRCASERVVEVMQAVHLMLGFPLFVVVVGLDPMWVKRSLEKYYRDKMSLDHHISRDEIQQAPSRYLEKIFQIPFTLRPLSKAGAEALLELLVTPKNAMSRDEEAWDLGDEIDYGADDEDATDHSNAAQTDEPVSDTAVPDEGVELSQSERVALKRFADLMPSPRATKRFVNTFRLMRVLYKDDWNYEVAAMAVAILVSMPKDGSDRLRESRGNYHQTLMSVYKEQATPGNRNVSDLGSYLDRLDKANSTSFHSVELALWLERAQRFSFEPSSFT